VHLLIRFNKRFVVRCDVLALYVQFEMRASSADIVLVLVFLFLAGLGGTANVSYK
jgi:hypothetical protein